MQNTLDATYLNITERIFNLRGRQVMIDSHLAILYQIDTKTLNRAVARNLERFPENFMNRLYLA